MLQSGLVAQIEERRVDRRYARQGTGGDQPAACESERLPRGGRPEVGRHIGSTQHQAREPRGCGRDGLHCGEAVGALDQADEVGRLACRGQQPVEDLQMAGRLRLRQHQKVWSSPGSEQSVQVGNTRPRVEPVDAESMEHAICWAACQVIESGDPGLGLVLGRDGVLEIQDCDVGARSGGLGEAIGTGCRRKEPASGPSESCI
jgi:hypothetical protein